MLQQTQVATVIPYYEKFMQRFPTTSVLAQAELDEVLHHWTGLGYYARARNIHKTAQRLVKQYNGELPTTQQELEDLPGIGRSTAGAIRAIAYKQSASILDGNVKRVLTRFHAISGYPGTTKVSAHLWSIADELTPDHRTDDYTQAIMDLGATLCTRRRPQCQLCPVAKKCRAKAEDAVEKYPQSKPKKDKPTRHSKFFVVVCNNQVLLEQKPLDGLWGGLWTPFERDQSESEQAFLEAIDLHPATVKSQHTAPKFRHTFTHFHLEIEPVYLYLSQASTAAVNDTHQMWYNLAEGTNQNVGLSAVAVKLLASADQPFKLEHQ